MSLSTSSSFQCSFSASPNTHQFLIVRFGYCSRLIILNQILQQTPSILLGETLFPFSNLRHPRQQQSIEFFVNEFLDSFNIHSSACQIICHKILSFALQFHTIHPSFKIEANIDHVEDLIIGEQGFQENPPPLRTTGAPESAIERLRKQKFDGFNKEEEEKEIEDCSVCYEEVKGKGEEVSRIPCGHVYHKTCILTWLQINNSCPLCRAPLQS